MTAPLETRVLDKQGRFRREFVRSEAAKVLRSLDVVALLDRVPITYEKIEAATRRRFDAAKVGNTILSSATDMALGKSSVTDIKGLREYIEVKFGDYYRDQYLNEVSQEVNLALLDRLMWEYLPDSIKDGLVGNA